MQENKNSLSPTPGKLNRRSLFKGLTAGAGGQHDSFFIRLWGGAGISCKGDQEWTDKSVGGFVVFCQSLECGGDL
jgi:hypothetical protein